MTELTSSNEFESKIRLMQKKKKRNLIVKIVSACIAFSLIFVYFITPISRVSNTTINGNVKYTTDQILEIAGLNKKDSLYLISKDEIAENLKNSPLIVNDSVEVKLSPLGLDIQLEEIVPVLKYENDVYMSNGTTLDKSLLQSKDPLVIDYLFVNTQNLITLYSKPYEDKFVSSRVSHLSKLILNLGEEERNKIVGVSYDSKNYYYCFYFQVDGEETLLKIVFDSAKRIDTLVEILSKDRLDRFLECLVEENVNDKFVAFEETLNGETKTVKSIKVVMHTIEEKIYYYVKYNNPSFENEEIKGEEFGNV